MKFDLIDHNRNQKYNTLHEFFWGFGSAFHSIYAITPLFLKKLGAPDNIAMASTGLFSILVSIPMLITAIISRNILNLKRAIILVHSSILIVTFLLGYTFTHPGINSLPYAWKIYLVYFILYGLSLGIIVPIWADFLDKVTMKSKRGEFFGIGFAANSLGGFIGGLSVNKLLKINTAFPNNFGYGFFILFVSLFIATLLFYFYKEKPQKNKEKRKTITQYKKEIKIIIRTHKNFHKYLLSRVFYCASLPAMGLYAIFSQNKFDFEINEVGVFTILNVISMGLCSNISGILGDKYGHKSTMLLAYFFQFTSVIIAILAKNMMWVYLIFLSIGAGQGFFMPSSMNLVYDFARNNDKKTYMALIDTFLAPFSMIFILGVGFLVNINEYIFSFKILSVNLLIALAILYFFVTDPKKETIQY